MTIHSVLGAILIGLVIGALARFVLPGKQPIPIWLTILVGIGSAFVGTALARAMGIPIDTPGVDWGELLVQVIVAVLGVALVTSAFGRSTFGRHRFGGSRLTRRW
ncbi:MAG: GlsB/YeaQ/YmgE family stress response membrane protein [Mycobacterium sp.]